MNPFLKSSLLDAVICGLNIAAYRRNGNEVFLFIATVCCLYAVKEMRLYIKFCKTKAQMREMFERIKKDISEGD